MENTTILGERLGWRFLRIGAASGAVFGAVLTLLSCAFVFLSRGEFPFILLVALFAFAPLHLMRSFFPSIALSGTRVFGEMGLAFVLNVLGWSVVWVLGSTFVHLVKRRRQPGGDNPTS